jgi:hypothetical protein
VHPTDIRLGAGLGVAHQQGANPLLHGQGDHLRGGVMVGLVHAAAVARLAARTRA